ncbi:hypothetical protein H4R35_004911 [Dimargaris xerosporica]|nr:hypothetical protein H4R35_004911 [Dimargaris xerosporica]
MHAFILAPDAVYGHQSVINAETIVAHQPDNAHLSADDVIVEWLPLNYGKKDQNPVDSIQFYNKFNDYQSFHIPRQNVSCLIPTTFSEMAIRVYARDISKVGMIQRAFRRLMKQWQLQPNSPQIGYVPNQGHEVPGAFESPRKRRLTFLE